jgi:hypothetical protein
MLAHGTSYEMEFSMHGHRYTGAYTSVSLDLHNCGGPLRDAEEADRLISDLIRNSGMTIRKKLIDPFETSIHVPGSDSYMVYYTALGYTLEESGVYIVMISAETWPEVKMVKIIIDLCHFTRSNRGAAVKLADAFEELFAPQDGDLVVARRTIEDMEGSRM